MCAEREGAGLAYLLLAKWSIVTTHMGAQKATHAHTLHIQNSANVQTNTDPAKRKKKRVLLCMLTITVV